MKSTVNRFTYTCKDSTFVHVKNIDSLKSQKQKIILVGVTYPYRGGIAVYMTFLYNALKSDFDVEVINFSMLYPEMLFPGKTQYDTSAQHLDKTPSKRMMNSMNPLSWRKTVKYINSKNPDLILFDWWHPFFGMCYNGICRGLKKGLREKVVFNIHNVVSHEGSKVDAILTKLGLRNGTKFLTLSNKVAEDIKTYSGDAPIFRTELPTHGWYPIDNSKTVLEQKKSLGFDDSDIVLLFFGYIRKYKGLDILIEAFSELTKQHNNVKLLVAGEFYEKPEFYHHLIEKFRLQDKVKMFNEFIPNEEVAKYFQSSDAVVLPYRSATQSGIMNIAYGFSKPVIVTNVGGLAEFVQQDKTGIVIPTSDHTDIVAGINRYLGMKDEVDFEENVKEKVAGNSFGDVVGVFREMLNT